jgi:hypothetical protein
MSNDKQRDQNIQNQIIADEIGNINVKGDVYLNTTKKRSSRFIIQMALGVLLPPFSCLLTSTAYISRYYVKGVWTTGVLESVITVGSIFGLLVLSFFLFMIGVSGLGKATMKYAAKFSLSDFIASAKSGVQKVSDYFKEHSNWLEAIKGIPQILSPRLNVDATDFKERFIAILLSLVIPGAGLIYRKHIGLGILSLVFTVVGYFAEFFPGVLLHLLVIIISGLIEKPKSGLGAENQPTQS